MTCFYEVDIDGKRFAFPTNANDFSDMLDNMPDYLGSVYGGIWQQDTESNITFHCDDGRKGVLNPEPLPDDDESDETFLLDMEHFYIPIKSRNIELFVDELAKVCSKYADGTNWDFHYEVDSM